MEDIVYLDSTLLPPNQRLLTAVAHKTRAARRLSLRECCAVMGIASGILIEMVDQGKITPEQGMAMVGESMDVPMLRAALDMVWAMGIEG